MLSFHSVSRKKLLVLMADRMYHLNLSLVLSYVHILQLDHYPVYTYTLPGASDIHFNLVKSIFLGKVFGKCVDD